MRKKEGLIFVVSGPSGSGKTTLVKGLLKDRALKRRLGRSVSVTTRPRRSGEEQGKDYFFISDKEFKQQRKNKKILEWTRYLGYYYGTPKDFVQGKLTQARSVILCLDLKGAFKIKEFSPKKTIMFFLLPPSLEALEERIKKRCHKTKKEEIRQRLRLARQELVFSRRYDYRLVNKNLGQTLAELKSIILKEIGNS